MKRNTQTTANTDSKTFNIGDKVKDLSGIIGTVTGNGRGEYLVRVTFGEDGKSNWRDLKPHQLTKVTEGELPLELTLLVTGTGKHSNEKDTELLYRTEDATMHFGSNKFTLLPHTLIDRYNNYQTLLDSNRELRQGLADAKTILYNVINGLEKKPLTEIMMMIDTILFNNAKNIK